MNDKMRLEDAIISGAPDQLEWVAHDGGDWSAGPSPVASAALSPVRPGEARDRAARRREGCMTKMAQLLCGKLDPETTDEHVGDPPACDFLRNHSGPCSWALEREGAGAPVLDCRT